MEAINLCMNYLDTKVKIGNKNGEITNILGVGYEITFFDTNLGKVFID